MKVGRSRGRGDREQMEGRRRMRAREDMVELVGVLGEVESWNWRRVGARFKALGIVDRFISVTRVTRIWMMSLALSAVE